MLLRRRKNPYRELEKTIGYKFRRLSLLETALTHRSYRFERPEIEHDNQRLEYLGDAALALAAAAYFYRKMANVDEGALTSFRSQLTSGKALSKIARDIDVGRFVLVGRGEEKSGGRKRLSLLEDALEAVVGAAFLDGGLKAVEKIFGRVFVPIVENMSMDVWADNPKGKLQEVAQRKWRKGPQYRVVAKTGPPHAAVFTVEAMVDGKMLGRGKGPNKQEAETRAAHNALRRGLK